MNEFDKPIGQRFVPTYAPMPLEAFTRLAMSKQRTHDMGMAKLGKLRQDFKIKADPFNEDYANTLTKRYLTEMDEISSIGAKNGWSPELENRYNNLANEVANNQEIQILADQHKMFYDDYLGELKKQKASGEYLEFLDPIAKLKGDPNKLTRWNFTGLSKMLNWQEAARNAVGDMKDSGGKRKVETIDPITGNKTTTVRGGHGVTEEMLQDRIKSGSVRSFKQSIEGKQYTEFIKSVNPDASQEEIDKHLANYLFEENRHKLRWISESEDGKDLGPADLREKADNKHQPDLSDVVENIGIQNLAGDKYNQAVEDGLINDDGTINYSNLRDNFWVPDPIVGKRLESKPSVDKHERISEIIFNSATALGIDPSKVRANPDRSKGEISQNEVNAKYNELVKSKTYARSFLPNEREIMSNDIASHPDGYEIVKDLTPGGYGTGNVKFKRNDEVNMTELHYVDDEPIMKVEVTEKGGTDPTGETKVYYVRPKGKKIYEYFKTGAEVQKEVINYIQGNYNEDIEEKKKSIKDRNGNIVENANINGIQFDEIISVVDHPVGGKIVVYSNPLDRREQQVFHYHNYGIRPYGSYLDFHQKYSSGFFNTQTGGGYVQNIETNKQRAEAARMQK